MFDFTKELELPTTINIANSPYQISTVGQQNNPAHINTIVSYIIGLIKKYNVFLFNFIGCIRIDKEQNWNNDLPDKLIDVKESYPDFAITSADIATEGTNSSLIRKMSMAGFINTNINYNLTNNLNVDLADFYAQIQ